MRMRMSMSMSMSEIEGATITSPPTGVLDRIDPLAVLPEPSFLHAKAGPNIVYTSKKPCHG